MGTQRRASQAPPHAGEPRTSALLFPGHSYEAGLQLLAACLATMVAAILLLLLPFSQVVWRFAPQLHFLQFPWRWLLVGSLAATLALALAVESRMQVRVVRDRRSGAPASVVVAMTCAAALCAGAWLAGYYAQNYYAQSCDEEDNVRAQQALLLPADTAAAPAQPPGVEAPAGFEGTDEYTPDEC